MPHQSPNLPPPKPEAVARALEFCRKRGSFIFREVQNEFNFGRDELIMVMDALRRGGFIEKFGPVRDGQPEWRMRPAPDANAFSDSASGTARPPASTATPRRDNSLAGRVRRFCRGRGEVTLKDVMDELEISRAEAEPAMNELFRAHALVPANKLRGEWTVWLWVPEDERPGFTPGRQYPYDKMPAAGAAAEPASAPKPPKPPDKKRYAAKDSSHPQARFWSTTSGMLYWAAAALGLACMIDTLRQSTSFGLWPPFAPLYYFYYPVLTAYAAARDREKRVRRAQVYEKRMGEVFFYGWGAVLIFIWLYDWAHNSVFYPRTLEPTLAVVLSVFAGVRIAGAVWPIVPFDPDDPNDPDADPPQPGPQPLPGPNPAPGPLPGPTPTPTPGQDDHARFAAACQRLGTFRAEDLVRDQGCSIHVAGGWIGQFIKEGLIRKGPDGRYQWIGG